jgi:putative ABC transport system permease protein
MKRNAIPPRWPDRFLRWYCSEKVLETLQGDLYELYQKRLAEKGKLIADLKFVLDVLSACRPFAFSRKQSGMFRSKNVIMINHYFTVSARTLLRNKTYSLINIGGLAIALACCILIILYTKDEVSFDRFHENESRIYRITAEVIHNQDGWEDWKSGTTGMIQGPEFKNSIPEIESFARLRDFTFLIRKGNDVIKEPSLYVDDSFFTMFDFRLLQGDRNTVFTQVNSVVLTPETALKYLGSTDVLGKNVELGTDGAFETFVVTGLVEKPPVNSTIQFGMLVPFSHYERDHADNTWLNFYLNTFVLLHPQADAKRVESKFADVFALHASEEMKNARNAWGFTGSVNFGLQPLTEIHLHPDLFVGAGLSGSRDPFYIYILTSIAIFILLIACINFINLAVAQSLKRSKEVGIRKVAGGIRSQLVGQFFGESFMTCFIAYSLAVVLAQLFLPLFNELADKKLNLSYLSDAYLLTGFAGLLLITTVAAGFYPAMVYSRFQPARVLYGDQKLTSKSFFAKSLVVVQFALSTILIITTIAVYSQFNFISNKDLGFNDENLIMINLPWWKKNDEVLKQFKDRLTDQASILSVAGKNGGRTGTMVKVDGGKQVGTDVSRIDENYFSTLQIAVKEGRNFSIDFPSDTIHGAIVNEAFVRASGWSEPIGQTIDFFAANKKRIVVGVVKDYHFRSLKEEIAPHVFIQSPDMSIGQLWVKVLPNDIHRTIVLLKESYRQFVPSYPFEYHFADDMTAAQYEQEARWKRVVEYAAILSVFISSIGLFGLTTLVVGQRRREIAIRKVMGAPVSTIFTELSGSFMRLILVAALIAIPLGYYATDQWLRGFAYRVEIEWWVYLIVVMISLIIALITISFQSIKAAVTKPVNALYHQ